MKFSHSLIRKMVSGLPPLREFSRGINFKAFEVEEANTRFLDIKIPANRWADAASHWGIAKEAAAIFDKKIAFKIPEIINLPRRQGKLKVEVADPIRCPRYLAAYLELVKKPAASPAWLKKILVDCGLRPVNSVVDVMNYVMLEVGQPLHAFDAEKVEKGILVRRAKKGEKMTTIDGTRLTLEENDLLIADGKKPLALAGIKGGHGSEIETKTRAIIVEAANFEPTGIYRTSRRLNLFTDASARFGHGQSPELVEIGMGRALVLLADICGAELVDTLDLYPKKPGRRLLSFDLEKFNRLTGLNLESKIVSGLLRRLGLNVAKEGLIEIPPLRLDLNIFEDLVEEASRIYGLENIKVKAPVVSLLPPEDDGAVTMKEKIRAALVALGFDEVYNYSFASLEKGAVALENPISREKEALRTTLLSGLRKNIEDNSRFFGDIRIFELGKVFSAAAEEWRLGLAQRLPKTKAAGLRELKGAVESLLRSIGLTDFFFLPEGERIRIESDHQVIGYLDFSGGPALAELNVDRLIKLAEGEAEYLPLSPYPAIERDISLHLPPDRPVSEILEAIDQAKIKNLADVDLVDYSGKGELRPDVFSLTFRLVFQSDRRTLSDEEVNREMAKIIQVLKGKTGIIIR